MGYNLASTFLGRMYLSGEIEVLTEKQVAFLEKAIKFYKRSVPVIRDGSSRFYGQMGESWRHPSGWQAVVRSTSEEVLVVLHAFEGPPSALSVPLPEGKWEVSGTLTGMDVLVEDSSLEVSRLVDFEAQVVLLAKSR
jgi:alpha-galactosidase